MSFCSGLMSDASSRCGAYKPFYRIPREQPIDGTRRVRETKVAGDCSLYRDASGKESRRKNEVVFYDVYRLVSG